jgi:transcriptional regulator of acetoin/glycerol metabolism
MHGSAGSVIPPDAQGVAVNRIRFLTMEQPEPSRVRPEILASWRRSRALRVAADKIDLPYVRDPNVDTPLTRSAEPVLRQLHEQLAGQPVSIVLTDAAGLVLSRRSADSSLDRHLDRVLLAPGFSYAEEYVGTNGIGTALEAGSPTQVFGHEHYAENLEDLACAGVPIHDPTTGRMVGVIDLTCWRKDAETLLLTLAKSTAEQIQRSLLTGSGMREYELLQAYRQTCRRTTGIVFAVTSDAVMLNDHARAELDPTDQSALLLHAGEISSVLAAGRRRSIEVTLPTGVPARMFCQQVGSGAEPAGLVVHVKLADPEAAPAVERPVAGTRMLMPGLVGDSPLWRRACTQVEATVTSGSWLALEGEPGVGKLALLRAVQLRQQPPRRFVVIDAHDALLDRQWMGTVRAALADTDSVIITHVDSLEVHASRALSAALAEARRRHGSPSLGGSGGPGGPWVAVTLKPGAGESDLGQLLTAFPTTVSVPPLRLRSEDVPGLVSFFLGKLGRGGHLDCSSDAMRLLMRSTWPGNVQQLQQLLLHVVQHRRSGTIKAEDLPPEMHSISRRVLSTLESMERDAIVRSLADANGNKVQAAKSLGLSRATIYRKIHEFGIVSPG